MVNSFAATAYYVSPTGSDSAACTQAAPCKSFAGAMSKASNGDTIQVAAGDYIASQSITGAKTVTFNVDPNARIFGISFGSNASGQTVIGGQYTGCNNCNTREGAPQPDGAVSFSGTAQLPAPGVRLTGAKIGNGVWMSQAHNVTLDHNDIGPLPYHLNDAKTAFVSISETAWANADIMDVYEMCNTPTPNQDITISDNQIHGLSTRISGAHPDGIQFSTICGDEPPKNVKLLRNNFYNNMCVNIRANPNDDLYLANNVFADSTANIDGGCGYSIDVLAANAKMYYNTFIGGQTAQTNPTSAADFGQSQVWVGNVGPGDNCQSWRATYSHNVWTKAHSCSTGTGKTDKVVASLNLNSDGSPKSGSPVIDAGDPLDYPATDFLGLARYSGVAPDAGAFEFGATGGVPDSAPSNTAVPTVSGNTTVGSVLSSSAGSWSGSPAPSFSYKWQRCNSSGASCVDISGATSTTYTLVSADSGSTIRSVVTATNGVGTASANSGVTAVIATAPSAPSNTAAPTVSGTQRVSSTLTASNGTWTGSPTAYTYQWQRCDGSGANCAKLYRLQKDAQSSG
jgi:hypothetical protein